MPIIIRALEPPAPVFAAEGTEADLPHFAAHFEFRHQGAVVVEQDTTTDIAACVYRIALCPEGFREDLPQFGVPELAFTTVPVDSEALAQAVEQWEPRADLDVEEQAEALDGALDQAYRRVTVEVL